MNFEMTPKPFVHILIINLNRNITLTGKSPLYLPTLPLSMPPSKCNSTAGKTVI